ncbi:MAG: hypothetical protein QM813_12390 [Verrucomicrobiota bacterium]
MLQTARPSLVVRCFFTWQQEEERRIGPVLRQLGIIFKATTSGEFQFVVVLTSCRDNTRGVVEAVASFPFIRFLDFPDPIGKGLRIDRRAQAGLPEAEIVGYVDVPTARLRQPRFMRQPC